MRPDPNQPWTEHHVKNYPSLAFEEMQRLLYKVGEQETIINDMKGRLFGQQCGLCNLLERADCYAARSKAEEHLALAIEALEYIKAFHKDWSGTADRLQQKANETLKIIKPKKEKAGE